jgi:hypothetical protein
MENWNIAVGEDNTRAQIQEKCRSGDHRYNGIVTSDTDVFMYSDHEKAKKSGYDFDGWDPDHELFFYTGEGGIGDQQFKAGNAAIAEHNSRGLALRLFVAVGNKPGSGVRIHRYVGQFQIASDPSHVMKRAPGRDGHPRKVIVFRLRPLGGVLTTVGQLSTVNGSAEVAEVEMVSVEAVPEADVQKERAEFERTASVVAEQREAALTKRFRKYLESHGREVKRYKVTTPNGTLFTDTADVTAGVLYEAKGTAERVSVRLALGQVLDYGRYVKGVALAVLLPQPPAADLVELLENHNVGCVVEGNPGEFSDMTSLGRCP